MNGIAEYIRRQVKEILETEIHPRSDKFPDPFKIEDDEAFTAFCSIFYHRWMQFEQMRQRSRFPRLWQSQIVRNVMKQYDRMTVDEKITKFNIFKRRTPWIHTQDSFILSWSARKQKNQEQAKMMENAFQQFEMETKAPHQELEALTDYTRPQCIQTQFKRARYAINWAKKMIQVYPVLITFSEKPLLPWNIDYDAIPMEPNDQEFPPMRNVSQKTAKQIYSDMEFEMQKGLQSEQINPRPTIRELKRRQQIIKTQRQRRRIQRQLEIDSFINKINQQKNSQEQKQTEEKQQTNVQKKSYEEVQLCRHLRELYGYREDINILLSRHIKNQKRNQRRRMLKEQEEQQQEQYPEDNQRPILTINRWTQQSIVSEYGISYKVKYQEDQDGIKNQIQRQQIVQRELAFDQLTGRFYDKTLVHHQGGCIQEEEEIFQSEPEQKKSIQQIRDQFPTPRSPKITLPSQRRYLEQPELNPKDFEDRQSSGGPYMRLNSKYGPKRRGLHPR